MTQCIECLRDYFKVPHVCEPRFLEDPGLTRRTRYEGRRQREVITRAFKLLKQQGRIEELPGQHYSLTQKSPEGLNALD